MNRRAGRREASSSSCSRTVPLAWTSSPPQSIWKRRAARVREAQHKPSASCKRAVKLSARLPNLGLDREAAAPWLAAHGPPSPTPRPSPPAPHPFSDRPHTSVSPWGPSSSRLPPSLSRRSPACSGSPAWPPWWGAWWGSHLTQRGCSLVSPQRGQVPWRGSEPPSAAPHNEREHNRSQGIAEAFSRCSQNPAGMRTSRTWVFMCRWVGARALTVPWPTGPQHPGDL